MTTVKVEHYDERVIKMTWSQNPVEQDIRKGFRIVNGMLSESPEPLFVLVDITAKPNFPLLATVQSAFTGPFRNPKLAEWLVVGSNRLAHMVEHTLSSLTDRENVRWFNTEEEALEYANAHVLTEQIA